MNSHHPVRAEGESSSRWFLSRRLAVWLAFLLIAGLPARLAQAQGGAATGTITGRVLNAANGKYLPNARVTIAGTSLETFTDEFGSFTLRNVPAGSATLRASYTGQPPETLLVTVEPGGTVTQEIQFGTARRREDGMIELDEFTVEANRFRNAQEIAINEERYAPNLKNVVAADAFGRIPDGNIGEFVKFIPGVQIDYGYTGGAGNAADNNATQISVRGFGPEFTSITVDGVPLTNASPATLTRAIGVDMMSLNNASRVEVIKVPTPDMPSNSPGGSINLVTKSAFEYAKPTLTWNASVNVNSEDADKLFTKTPGPANKSTYKTLPGVDLTYVFPINDKMGIAVTGAWSKTFNENHNAKSDWFYDTTDISSASTFRIDLTPVGGPLVERAKIDDVATTITPLTSLDGDQTLDLTNPILWRYHVTDTPNTVERTSGSLRWDWRPTSSQKISVGYTMGLTDTVDAQRRLQFYSKQGYVMDWGADFMTSYAFTPAGTLVNGTPLSRDFDPGAAVKQEVTTRDRSGITHTAYVKYTFQRGPWAVDANVSGSRSRGSYHDLENGHFSAIETDLTLGQIAFRDIHDGRPGRIELYDRAGSAVDWTDLSQWNAPQISAKSGETESLDERQVYQLNVRRDLDFLPWDWVTVSAKGGFYRERQRQKKWGLGTGYRMTYYGPVLALNDYKDDGYSGVSPGFGLPGQQWLSTYKLYDLWQEHPDYFNANSDADMGNNWQNYVNQQKSITETSDQFYFMLDGKVLKNRLNWVAGVRQETVTRKGYQPKQVDSWQYVKNQDGTLYRDATYTNGIRFDQAGSPLFDATATGQALRAQLDSLGLWYPDHVISSSSSGGAFYEYSKLRFIPFSPVDGKIQGKPTYMASAAYSITDNLVGRLSWNRSQAKPDFENGTLAQGGKGITITEAADPNASPRGEINISNPNLKPWIADSWDFQLAYYTSSGGKFAVTPFYKETRNFHETIETFSSDPGFEALLIDLGLDPSLYDDYSVTTTVNGNGTAKTLGYELEANQDLRILGGWGRYFQVFAGFSHHYVKQERTKELTAKPLAGTTASGGVSFATKRFTALLRGLYVEEKYESERVYTYNGNQYVVATYYPSTVNLDLSLKYQLTKHYGVFLDARNFLNQAREKVNYDQTGLVPSYAQTIERKEFGVTWYFGVNGTW